MESNPRGGVRTMQGLAATLLALTCLMIVAGRVNDVRPPEMSGVAEYAIVLPALLGLPFVAAASIAVALRVRKGIFLKASICATLLYAIIGFLTLANWP